MINRLQRLEPSLFTECSIAPDFDQEYQTQYTTIFDHRRHLLELIKGLKRDFTIRTNNGEYHFIKDLLLFTSEKIQHENSKNPDLQEFSIDLDVDCNFMKKFEALYTGIPVQFVKSDKRPFKNIANILQLQKFPEYLSQAPPNNLFLYTKRKMPQNFALHLELKERNWPFRGSPIEFTIKTGKSIYSVNRVFARLSNVIKNFLEENPKAKEFKFIYDDTMSEFQIISAIFSGTSKPIPVNQIDSLLTIAEQLEIQPLIEFLETFSDIVQENCEKVDNVIPLISSYEDLIEKLLKISDFGPQKLCQYIIESSWVKTIPEVQELTAIILQIIHIDIVSHKSIVELIKLLDEQKDKKHNLAVLLPFLRNHLLSHFAQTNQNLSFLYHMSRSNLVSIDLILEHLKSLIFRFQDEEQHLTNDSPKMLLLYRQLVLALSWFYPELQAQQPTMVHFFPSFEESLSKAMSPPMVGPLDQRPTPPPVDQYTFQFFSGLFKLSTEDMNFMRDNCVPKDELIQIIRNDDVDSLQSIYLSNPDRIKHLHLTIFDKDHPSYLKLIDNALLPPTELGFKSTSDSEISVIDYAALWGSINCFKVLFVNQYDLSKNSMTYAVLGGNLEILRIILQQNSLILENSVFESGIKALNAAISTHQNQIIDWLFEQPKFNFSEFLDFFLDFAVSNGNSHAIDVLLNHGINLSNQAKIAATISVAADKGFFKILHFLLNFIKADFSIIVKQIDSQNVNESQYILNERLKSTSSFGSLLIFKLFIDSINPKSSIYYINALHTAAQFNHLEIFQYILEDCDFQISLMLKNQLLVKSIKCLSEDIYKYLLEDCEIIITSEILGFLCRLGNLDLVQKLTQKALDAHLSINFTEPFIQAIIHKADNIVQYFLDMKFSLDILQIFSEYSKIVQANPKSIKNLLEAVDKEWKNGIITDILKETVKTGDMELIEFFLDQEIQSPDLLITAVQFSVLQVVEAIVKRNSSPSFVNYVGPEGTALQLAVRYNKNDIVKFLLTINGIDVFASTNERQSPLKEACLRHNAEAVELLIPFVQNNVDHIKFCLNEMLAKNSIIQKKVEPTYKFLTFINNPSPPPKFNDTPILLNLLSVPNVDPNITTETHSLLSYCIENQYNEVVELLLNLPNLRINDRIPSTGDTCLHLSINDVELFAKFLGHKEIDVNITNLANETPLIVAVNKDKIEIVQLLLSHPKFDPKLSQLDYAFILSIPSKSISRYLLTAPSLNINYLSKGKSAVTPLMEALRVNDDELIDLITHHPKFDLNKSCAVSCLFRSALSRNLTLFRTFLKLTGNNINIKNMTNKSLLTAAVLIDDNQNIVNEILNHENFDPVLNNIQTAFVYAKNDVIRQHLYDYDKHHGNHIKIEAMETNTKITGDKNYLVALDFLRQKKGLIPYIRPFCTYAVCDQTGMNQPLYLCKTCNLTKQHEAICLVCARFCHKNHEISFLPSPRFGLYHDQCYCGKHNSKCKCVPHVHHDLNEEEEEDKHEEKIENAIYEFLESEPHKPKKQSQRSFYTDDLLSGSDYVDFLEDYEVKNAQDQPDLIQLALNPRIHFPNLQVNNLDFNSLENLKCTFDLCRGTKVVQPMYQCNTCQITCDLCICQHCAIRCHRGHRLSFRGFRNQSNCHCFTQSDCVCTRRKTQVCSYLLHGKDYIPQIFHHCLTCGLTGEFGCCHACASNCHANHEIEKKYSPSSYCDCGVGHNGSECKCCKFPEFNHLIHCTNRDHKNQAVKSRRYHCLTCNLTSTNEGICEGCAIQCHFGHNVQYIDTSEFVCECNSLSYLKDLSDNQCVSDLFPEMPDSGQCLRLKGDIISDAYVCFTCDKEGKKKFCESCAVRCHKGHDIHLIDYSSFECSCEIEHCQCINK